MDSMPIMLVGLYVFILATLAGKEVITKVPPTLHTPLMSGANASHLRHRNRRGIGHFGPGRHDQ